MMKQMVKDKRLRLMKDPVLVTMAAAAAETVPAMEMGEEMETDLIRKVRKKVSLV